MGHGRDPYPLSTKICSISCGVVDKLIKLYVGGPWGSALQWRILDPPRERYLLQQFPSLFKLKLPCSNLQFRNCLFTTWLKLSRQYTEYSHLLINYKFDNFLQKEMTFHKCESPVIINCSEMDSKFLRNGKRILEILEKGSFELPF